MSLVDDGSKQQRLKNGDGEGKRTMPVKGALMIARYRRLIVSLGQMRDCQGALELNRADIARGRLTGFARGTMYQRQMV